MYSIKTTANDLNNDILLFPCHLIVTWQATAPVKDIRTDIFNAAGDVGVGLGTPRTFAGDEFMHTVHWLHMHWLPDGTTFSIDSGDCLKNFRWAGLSKVKVPKKYGQSMQLSNLTIYFDNLSTRSSSNKYDNYAFDFMIVWPMQSVTKNPEEIQMLHEMAERQKTKKIIYLTIKEPWYSPEPLKPYVDRIVTLDCENDNPKEYQRIMAAYKEDQIHQEQRNRFY